MKPLSAIPQALVEVPGKGVVIPAKAVSIFADPKVKRQAADAPSTFGEK